MEVASEDVLKILLAVLVGGLIGFERELRDKDAGFRTLIFICLGATLFTILSVTLGGAYDASRVAAGIVTGVGFIGAGSILRERGHVTGITTASTIWLTAALGMCIGAGRYLLAGVVVVVALIVLALFPRLEERMEGMAKHRSSR